MDKRREGGGGMTRPQDNGWTGRWKRSVGGPKGTMAPVRWSKRGSMVERWARVGAAQSHMAGVMVRGT